jgi:hypothetical protein
MSTQVQHWPESRKPRLLTKLLLVLAMIAPAVFVPVTAQASQNEASDLIALLPNDAPERFADMNETLGADSNWQNLLLGAINPDDYECEQSNFSIWADEVFGAIDFATLDALFYAGVPFWAGDYTVLFDHDPSDTYVGVNGEQTREQTKRHRDNKRFWDVETSDIQLHGMHGADIADDAKMIPLLQFVIGVSEAEAQDIVDGAQALIETHPALDYDHPLFSLNAFAVPGFEIPGFGAIPDKIVMGDGVIDAVTALGLGDNAPDYIHAHEFAHHVQFELDAAPPYGDPETDRKTELMADAFGAYYAAHARGAGFQNQRVVDLARSAGSVGDCGFDQPGHHGTPNQRAAAAEWGSDLALQTRPRGKIISASVMLELFEDQLPIIVAPDAN